MWTARAWGGRARAGGVRGRSNERFEAPFGLVGALGEALDHVRELLVALVGAPVLARGVAGEDALEDDRELPARERHVEVDLLEVAARALGVALADLLPRGEPGRRGGRLEERHQLVARL